ncbi:Crp/Fnr family transcriptional regulator [Paenibacillus thiaminolyticus]|uniref:Crp/Fnr family transcriptional regulator n=1 Tax=Paenibacillus thiaminolyticus TaxID=49283 RepID=UPI0011651F84|nr:Crp/Fnr family transcriptional regulator [Paenibacillus thiaminolyticus]NGP59610.1 Crp/Fnr family transcriptional regulator [Paenibacillus thiaminolyticus]
MKPNQEKIEYLSQFNLLHSLSEEDLIEMDQLTVITTIRKNTFIQTPDSSPQGLYFVKRGTIRLFKLTAEGKQFTLDILREGNVFGEVDLISFGTRYLYIETLEECDICLMDTDRFESFIIHRSWFMLNLIKVMSERIIRMSDLAQHLALGNLQDKIIYALLKLADHFGLIQDNEYYRIDYSISHQEIANLVGASREAVTASLQELAAAGVIKTGFKTIFLHREKLRERQRG